MTSASPALTNAFVVDTDGKTRTMRELWRDRPALIIWVRHFG